MEYRQMNTRILISMLCIAVSAASATAEESTRPTSTVGEQKPNIIVIFTDDMGYADLKCQGELTDVVTPHIDRLAAEGVRFTDGYVSAPQCSPSRAGLVTGRYQQRFGLDQNQDVPLPAGETTIADRLTAAGYVTGMVGKWHLAPNALSTKWAAETGKRYETQRNGRIKVPLEDMIPFFPRNRGFTETFDGNMNRYWATYSLDGKDLNPKGEWVIDQRYRLDVQSDAAVTFIERNHEQPFFLYLPYYAPHMPLESPEKYLSRFPGDMPERRRYALAMISAMDDGVGRILDTLQKHELEESTLIFFISDNGAPLKLTKVDNPIGTDMGGWNGSINDPLVGEKGMLTGGGIRVPFIARWKGVLAEGKVYSEPVISLDVGATAVALAGLDHPEELDGVNLIPYLTGKKNGSPHDALYWRFWNQGAIRKGKWKYLQAGGKSQFLFDLTSPQHEKQNLIDSHPEIAAELQQDLKKWAATLKTPGLSDEDLQGQEADWYDHHLASTSAAPKEEKKQIQEELIAFANPGKEQSLNLFLADTQGQVLKQLTHGKNRNWFPAWSPDGKSIAYTSDKGSAREFYGIKLSDHTLVKLTEEERKAPDFRKRGIHPMTRGKAQVWIMDADGSKQKQLTFEGRNAHPAWSPDGKQIAFSSTRTGKLELYLMDPDGGNQRQLTHSPDEKPGPFENLRHIELHMHGLFSPDDRGPINIFPTWSPDGKKIAFCSIRAGSYAIWVMDCDGKNMVRLTDPAGEHLPQANCPSWSPKGDKIAYWSGVKTHGSIWVMNSDGSDQKRISNQPKEAIGDEAAWSPDGRILYTTSRRDKREGVQSGIWIMNDDGTDQKPFIRDVTPGFNRASWRQ